MNVIHIKIHSFIILSFFFILVSITPLLGAETKSRGNGKSENLINKEVARLLKNKEKDKITLPLKLALGIALENNLDIQIQKVGIPISEKAVIEKDAHFDPVLFGEATDRRFEQQTSSALSGSPIFKNDEQYGRLGIRKLFRFGLETESYFETLRSRNNSSFEGLDPQYKSLLVLSLRQPLLQDFGCQVNTSDIRIAENRLEIQKNSFRSQVIHTLDRSEQTYYDLSGAIETFNLREESLRLAEELLSNNQERFDAGLTHIGEVQEAETAVASRQEQVVSARQQAKNIGSVLKNILQIKPDSPLYPLVLHTGELSAAVEKCPAREEALSRSLKNRPDYLQKIIEVKNKDVVLKYSKNQLLPRLDLIGTFGLNGLSGDATMISFSGQSSKSPFGGGYADSLDHLADADGYEWLVGLTIEIPLGNRADRSRYDQAKLSKRRSIMDLKNLEDRIDMEIKVALEDIQSSFERISVADRFVRLAAKTLHQEEERLKRGLSNTFRVLNFQDDLIDAKIRKIRAQVDYQKGLASLYKAMGTNIQRHGMCLNIPDRK